MRFDVTEFGVMFPQPPENFRVWFPESEGLDSFLASGGNAVIANSLSSASATVWADLQGALAANMAVGIQAATGAAEKLSDAARSQWNIGSSGLIPSIFAGHGPELAAALQAYGESGFDPEILAKRLSKVAIGVAISALSVSFPPLGAFAALISGAVKVIVTTSRAAKNDDSPVIPVNFLPASGATAAGCTPGSANAADRFMLETILLEPVFAAAGQNGLPDTQAQIEDAAKLADMTRLLLPAELPTGKTNEDLTWVQSAVPSDHPLAPAGKSAGGIEDLREARPGELYVLEDDCNPSSVWLRVGLDRELGSQGYGWAPGRSAFTGPGYASGNARAPGGRENDSYLARKIGTDARFLANTWTGAESMFPAASSFLSNIERQAMDSPYCYLFDAEKIALFWDQWQSGMTELSLALEFEGNQMPGSLSRRCWAFQGWRSPGSGCEGLAGLEATHWALSRGDGIEFAVSRVMHHFLRQASCWITSKSTANGNVEAVETWPTHGQRISSLEWLDGEPEFLLSRQPYRVPTRIYRFRDPSGKITAPGTIGKFGPLSEISVKPWANLLRSRQEFFLKTLQVAYVSEYAPAFRNSLLRQELKSRREQLLSSDARARVELPDVLDNVGPDSYRSQLESSGVGKFGAFGFTAGGNSESEDPGPMPFGAYPVPIPPGAEQDTDSDIGIGGLFLLGLGVARFLL